MRDELGAHPNAQVLYPVGARPQAVTIGGLDRPHNASRFVVVFAGNLSNWYGQMLERLVTTAIEKKAPVEFRIYGGNESWSSEFDRLVRKENIFCGLLPFDKLRQELAAADVLILPMALKPNARRWNGPVSRPSFWIIFPIKSPFWSGGRNTVRRFGWRGNLIRLRFASSRTRRRFLKKSCS